MWSVLVKSAHPLQLAMSRRSRRRRAERGLLVSRQPKAGCRPIPCVSEIRVCAVQDRSRMLENAAAIKFTAGSCVRSLVAR